MSKVDDNIKWIENEVYANIGRIGSKPIWIAPQRKSINVQWGNVDLSMVDFGSNGIIFEVFENEQELPMIADILNKKILDKDSRFVELYSKTTKDK